MTILKGKAMKEQVGAQEIGSVADEAHGLTPQLMLNIVSHTYIHTSLHSAESSDFEKQM